MTAARVAAWHVLALVLMTALSASAAILTVTTNADSGAGSLRQAIASAAAGDSIDFAAGIATVELTGGSLVIDRNLTIKGPGANLLSIRRAVSAPPFRILDTSTTISNISVAIADLTIADGKAPPVVIGGSIYPGGGILNAHTLTLTRVAVVGNATTHSGGGIANMLGGSLVLPQSTVSGNSTSGGFGGGIYSEGPATIVNSTISGNTSAGYGGGVESAGTVTISSSTIYGNTASLESGGVHTTTVVGSAVVDNTIIAKNTAPLDPDIIASYTSHGHNLVGINFTCGPLAVGDQSGCPATPLDPVVGRCSTTAVRR